MPVEGLGGRRHGELRPNQLEVKGSYYMVRDIRFGLRLLWKQKAFSLAALLTPALCIGANTALFTILNTVTEGYSARDTG